MRIDMTTREWHDLVKPVIPHTLSNDKDYPELGQVRIEAGSLALYAAATDRYTLAVERRPLARTDRYQPQPPVHAAAAEVKASLSLFAYTKDDNPPLSVTIDTVHVPVDVVGVASGYTAMAVTLTSSTGARMVLHDRRRPERDPLSGWQKIIAGMMARAQHGSPPGLDLGAQHLAKWQPAQRGGERLTFWAGPNRRSSLLVTVEKHFAGVWTPEPWGSGESAAPPDPAGLPWLAELAPADLETGEKREDGQ